MYKKFINALTWNSTTTFLYKIMLLSHQIMLYSVISKTLYGIQSTLFASIYILIAITNFGFEGILISFFSTFSKNKQQFLHILYYFILRIMIVTIISTILFIIMTISSYDCIQNIKLYCDNKLLLILILIFFIESIKKSMNTVMQLAFLNKEIAYAELGMLISYISIIWIIYQNTNLITLNTIFFPMLFTSSLEFIYVFFVLLQYYKQLPTINTTPINIPCIIIIKQLIYNYIHQITKTIFSPNSITILFVYTLGFQQAATIKFFTNIITFSYTCIHKTIGVTSSATFAAINTMPLNFIKTTFTQITKTYFKFLYSMGLVTLLVLGYSWYTATITYTMIIQIILFFLIVFFENITLTYEQLFIAQHRSKILAGINVLELSSLLPILYWWSTIYSGLPVLLVFLCIKLCSLSLLTLLTQRYWYISPN